MRHFLFLFCAFLPQVATFAQTGFGLRGEFVQARTKVDNTNPNAGTYAGVALSRPAYGAGLFYRHDLFAGRFKSDNPSLYRKKGKFLRNLSLAIEADYQMKGQTLTGVTNPALGNLRYYYIGISPMLGYRLHKHLRVDVGYRVNTLVSQKHGGFIYGVSSPRNDFTPNASKQEGGWVLRFSLIYRQWEAQLTHFRALNHYDSLGPSGIPTAHGRPDLEQLTLFYSRTWNLGLAYRIWAKDKNSRK